MKLTALLVFFVRSMFGQPAGLATTKGACSPASSGSNNVFNITCDIGREQGDQMIAILNKILANQLDPDAVTRKLDEILHAVNANAPKKTYLLNGGYRVISPGVFSMDGSPNPDFQRMLDLNASKSWTALASLCEKWMKDTPDWYSPFVFAGFAYSNLGQKGTAIRLLERADAGMADNPDYGDFVSEAKRLLALLRLK